MTTQIEESLRTAISCFTYQDAGGIWRSTQDLAALADLLKWTWNGETFESVFRAGQDSLPRDKHNNMLKVRAMRPGAGGVFSKTQVRKGREILNTKFRFAGNCHTFRPQLKYYDYLLIFSNWPADILLRVLEAGHQLKQGVEFGEMVLLAGTHDGPEEKSLATLYANHVLDPYLTHEVDPRKLPTGEMACIVWLLNNVLSPDLLQGVRKITKVPAPMVKTPYGPKSPSTRSSMVAWRKKFRFNYAHPRRRAGHVLAVTNGWQTMRGELTILTELLSWECGFHNYIVETVGAPRGFDHPFDVEVAELNRCQYEVNTVIQNTR